VGGPRSGAAAARVTNSSSTNGAGLGPGDAVAKGSRRPSIGAGDTGGASAPRALADLGVPAGQGLEAEPPPRRCAGDRRRPVISELFTRNAQHRDLVCAPAVSSSRAALAEGRASAEQADRQLVRRGHLSRRARARARSRGGGTVAPAHVAPWPGAHVVRRQVVARGSRRSCVMTRAAPGPPRRISSPTTRSGADRHLVRGETAGPTWPRSARRPSATLGPRVNGRRSPPCATSAGRAVSSVSCCRTSLRVAHQARTRSGTAVPGHRGHWSPGMIVLPGGSWKEPSVVMRLAPTLRITSAPGTNASMPGPDRRPARSRSTAGDPRGNALLPT